MSLPERRPFLAWPGWRHVKFAWLLSVVVSLWFAFVFVGADWFTRQRALRVRVHLDAELHIPLIPSFTLVYMSIYVLFFAVPFVLRTRREIITLALAQTLAISLAGICFLLIPAQLAFAPATNLQLGIWKALFHFADRLNLDYNLVPSLHVALSVICIELFVVHAGWKGKVLLRAWGVLIAASTLFTHQHHLLDVLTGYLLALATVKLLSRFPLRTAGASWK
jgi:membrane-associated phospholipid phosphatase